MALVLKIHLGCGERYIDIPGWVHVDMYPYEHVDVVADASDLHAFKSGEAELIYACHVLQYIDLPEVLPTLKEWYRVLEPGGVLRLAVPDFSALCAVYLSTGSMAMVIGPIYGRLEWPNGTLIYHKMAYDFASLAILLRQAGFRAIRKWDWSRTEHHYVDDGSQAYYPHMDKENGMLVSLNVEATK